MLALNAFFEPFDDVALLILRVIVGAIFIVHGFADVLVRANFIDSGVW